MKYTYTAVDQKGRTKHGVLDAAGELAALAALRAQQLVPTKLAPAARLAQTDPLSQDGPRSIWEVELFEKDIHLQKFPRKKLLVLFTQLSVMLRAGVNLSMALEVTGAGEKDRKLRRVLRELHADLMGGVALSASMARFACFDSICVNLVRAGEADGHLERSFAQIADVQEKQHALQSKLISASIYPVILLVVVLGVLMLINTVAMPKFAVMFEQLGTDIPLLTQVVMGISRFLTGFWWTFPIGVALLVGGYQLARRKSAGFALKVDCLKLRLPVVGKLLRQSCIARFSRILAVLLESGQDFLSSLGIGRSVITNAYIRQGLAQVGDDVRVGDSISVSMQKHSFFDPVYISMLRAGEESGSLSDTLSKMAEMYEAETEESTKRLTTLMEPLMTVLIAVIVGFVVVAVVLPMFSMFNLVGNV